MANPALARQDTRTSVAMLADAPRISISQLTRRENRACGSAIGAGGGIRVTLRKPSEHIPKSDEKSHCSHHKGQVRLRMQPAVQKIAEKRSTGNTAHQQERQFRRQGKLPRKGTSGFLGILWRAVHNFSTGLKF